MTTNNSDHDLQDLISDESGKARDAARHLKSLTHEDNEHELWSLRNILIEDDPTQVDATDTYDATPEQVVVLIQEVVLLRSNKYSRDLLSELAMNQSLCPVHFVDWAICFDDQPQDCSQIRAIFPYGHDT